MRILILFIIAISQVWSTDWAPAQTIGTNGQNPQVSYSANGTAIAIWTDAFTAAIRAARFDGSSWGPPFMISSPTSEEEDDLPQVSMFSNGTAVAVWPVFNSVDAVRIQGAYFDGTNWQPAVDIAILAPGNDDHASPQVTALANGNAMAVWLFDNGTQTKTQASLFSGSSLSWGMPVDISLFSDLSDDLLVQPQVVPFGPAGAVAIFVVGAPTGGSQIQSNFFSGFSWLPPGQGPLVPNSTNATSLELVSDGASNVITSWSNDNELVQASKFLSPVLWSSAVTIGSDLSNSESFPSLAILKNSDVGQAIIVDNFVSVSTFSYSLFNGTTWSAPAAINSRVADLPDLSSDAFGEAFAIYIDDDDGSAQTVTFSGNSWSTATILDMGQDGFDTPQIASNPNGDTAAVWIDTVNNNIRASNTKSPRPPPSPPPPPPPGPPPPPPSPSPPPPPPPPPPTTPPLPPISISGKEIANRFPGQTEFFNKIEWTASPSFGVILYKVFRNGVVIGQVSARADLEFEDHNRPKHEIVTYSVTAVNLVGLESVPVSVTINTGSNSKMSSDSSDSL